MKYLSYLLFFFYFFSANCQDSLLLKMANENLAYMSPGGDGFKGEGWSMIKARAAQSQHVLIGEDHFTKEIPEFIAALGSDSDFDNFYIEIDPYTTALLEKSFEMTREDRSDFMEAYGEILSFYSLKDEYVLLERMVSQGMSLLGSDQIVMYDDRLLFDDLAKRTTSEEAKSIYEFVSVQSKKQFEKFLQDPSKNPMYMMLPDFRTQLAKLKKLKLTPIESDIIAKLEISADIYANQSHRKRVQLIKHHLMNDYPKWQGKRNLFKYGANHMARGESFLTVTDIGNIVANIAEANYQESFHIMVLGESGMQATAFESFPPQPINPNGFYLKHLQQFFTLTNDQDWAVFDLLPLRKELEKGSLNLENQNLIRTIKGFDVLVLIPEVSPAKF